MKILMQSIYFWPEIGGLENHVFYLCKTLVKRSHSVTVITSRSQKEFPQKEIIEGIEVIRKWCPGKHPLGWISTSLISIPAFLKKAKKFDIWQAQTHPSALPPIIARTFFKRPLVLTVHTSHFLKLAKKWWYKPILKWILKKPDLVLAASEEIKEVCLSLVKNLKVQAIVNAVDTNIFSPQEPSIKKENNEIVLICPRRLVPKNGVEFLIKAIPLIKEKITVRLYIIGDGPLHQQLEELSRNLKVEKWVSFLGAKPNNMMPGFLSGADIVVIPSLLEATSVAALEAMSCERVVAASAVGGLPTLIDEKVGILFKSGDVNDLAEKVIQLALREDKEKMGRAAREKVLRNWSWENLTEKHLNFYQSLIEQYK